MRGEELMMKYLFRMGERENWGRRRWRNFKWVYYG
jgi:hypothetical protein